MKGSTELAFNPSEIESQNQKGRKCEGHAEYRYRTVLNRFPKNTADTKLFLSQKD